MTAYDTIFGSMCDPATSDAVVIPAPFDATCSYTRGARGGPEAIRAASSQLDFEDRRFGNALAHGIAMESADPGIIEASTEAAALIDAWVAAHPDAADDDDIDRDTAEPVDALCERANAIVAARIGAALDAGKLPCLLGGEHAMSLGAMMAVGERFDSFGVLHVDAHMDLRRAYQGLRYSHASVMLNALEAVPAIGTLVQLGIRDYAADEARFAAVRGVRTLYWDDLVDELESGASWRSLADDAISLLPDRVYVTLDIDGLEPSLCPSTGTPVPGGLSWDRASTLLAALAESGKAVVGCDLVEIAPGNETPAGRIDAIVGARMLYRMLGAALTTRG